MAQEGRKKEIDFWVEIFRAMEIALFGLTGGTVGLVLSDLTVLRIAFAITGFLGMVVLGIGLYRLQQHIRHLIAQLKED